MTSDTPEEIPISKKTVVYTMPGAAAVTVRRDETYRMADEAPLSMDLYYPPDAASGSRWPAVVIVAGYPDAGFQRMVGCRFKEMGSTVSWGRLLAASGIVAIAYTNREPATDILAVLQYVRQHAAALGIDENRIGLWASSGNVPVALSMLMRDAPERLKCAVLCYGLMLDLDGADGVAEASKTWKFTNPCAGKSVEDLAPDVPLFIARAGQDQMPRLNETLDRVVAKALTANLPLTVVNHPEGPHAFDLLHDSETTREVIRRILSFMQFHLSERR